jgi:hypothetical protein
MKYFKFFIVGYLLIILISSCKKEPEDRDKFIGTWHGVINLEIPGWYFNSAIQSMQIITKGMDTPKQMIITELGDTAKAYVNGNKYSFSDYTRTGDLDGQPISLKLTGSGTIYNNVNVVTEVGTLNAYFLEQEYTGKWSCIRYRQ